MFKTSMAVIDRLQKEIDDLKRNNTLWRNKYDNLKEKLENSKLNLQYTNRMRNLDVEEAKNTIRKEIQKSLVTADVERAKLQGKVEAYDKLMLESGQMMELFDKMITTNPKVNVLNPRDIT